MTDVAADVIAIIARKARGNRSKIKPGDRLEDLGIHSIDAVEMIFDLEEKFDIEIPFNSNNSRTEFDTVGKVVRAIENLVSNKS